MNTSRSFWLALALFTTLTTSVQAGEHPLLFIGDSHSAGTFGHTLDKLLRAIPESKVSTYAVCGSSPEWFFTGQKTYCGTYFHPADGKPPSDARTPLISPLLQSLKPEYTIVALGANQLNGSVEGAKKQVQHLVKEIHEKGSQCIWVGPPDEGFISRTAQDHFYEMLHSQLSDLDCQLIDSRKYTHYPVLGGDIRGDNIHYDSLQQCVAHGQGDEKHQCTKWVGIGAPLARKWAEGVAEVVSESVNKQASFAPTDQVSEPGASQGR